jgi:hypothetical protein
LLPVALGAGLVASPELALALDATAAGEQLVVLTLSVLYRSWVLPVAWQVLPGHCPGAWLPHLLQLLDHLHPAVPGTLLVLVLADRGLWSPRLWQHIQQRGWHPVLRVQDPSTFQPPGAARQRARTLVASPGHAWVGRGVAFRASARRQPVTLLVVWGSDQAEPRGVLTDLPPAAVGVCWYGLRGWIALGFRTEPARPLDAHSTHAG